MYPYIDKLANKIGKAAVGIPKKLYTYFFAARNTYFSRGYSNRRLISDGWVKSQSETIARYLYRETSNHIRERANDDESIVFGISGKWGVGKTNLIENILLHLKTLLKGKESPIKSIGVVTVNPWKYAGDRVGLLYDLSSQIHRERKMIKRGPITWLWHQMYEKAEQIYVQKLEESYTETRYTKPIIKINNWLLIIILVVFICTAVIYPIFILPMIDGWLYGKLALIKNLSDRNIELFVEGIKYLFTLILIPTLLSLANRSETKETNLRLFEFELDIKNDIDILRKNIRDEHKILIILENLDRLRAPDALATLDVIRSFFNYSNFIFVIAGDLEILEEHIGQEIVGTSDALSEQKKEMGRLYLKKLYTSVWHMPEPPRKNYTKAFNRRLAELWDQLSTFKGIDNPKSTTDEEEETFKSYIQSQISSNFPRNYRDSYRILDKFSFNFKILDALIQSEISEYEDLPKKARPAAYKAIKRLEYVRSRPSYVCKILLLQEVLPQLHQKIVNQLDLDLATFSRLELLQRTQQIETFVAQSGIEITKQQNTYLINYIKDRVKFIRRLAKGKSNIVAQIPTFLKFASLPDLDDSVGTNPEELFESLKTRENAKEVSEIFRLGAEYGNEQLENYANEFNLNFTKIPEPDNQLNSVFTYIQATSLLDEPVKLAILIRDISSDVLSFIARMDQNSEDRREITLNILKILNTVGFEEVYKHRILNAIGIIDPSILNTIASQAEDNNTALAILLDNSIQKAHDDIPKENHDPGRLLSYLVQPNISDHISKYPQQYIWVRKKTHEVIHTETFPTPLTDPHYIDAFKALLNNDHNELQSYLYRGLNTPVESLKSILNPTNQDLYQQLLKRMDKITNLQEMDSFLGSLKNLNPKDTDAFWEKISESPELSKLLVEANPIRNPEYKTSSLKCKKDYSNKIMNNIIQIIEEIPEDRHGEGIALLQQMTKHDRLWLFDTIPRIGHKRFSNLKKLEIEQYNQHIENLINSHKR